MHMQRLFLLDWVVPSSPRGSSHPCAEQPNTDRRPHLASDCTSHCSKDIHSKLAKGASKFCTRRTTEHSFAQDFRKHGADSMPSSHSCPKSGDCTNHASTFIGKPDTSDVQLALIRRF